jgi:hypothetical protein
MSTGNKRWLIAGVGSSVVVALVLVVALGGHGKRRPASDGEAGGAGASGGWRGFQDRASGSGLPPGAENGPGAGASAASGGPSAGGAATNVTGAMTAWRGAILTHDADTVVALDRAFLGAPGTFRPALVESAKGDGNERVRAFSTRVLGKLRDAALVETFAALLDDSSPYVRQNAAWALGELGGEESGRAAARRTTEELRRLGRRDTAPDVRVAANEALKRLQ